MNEDSYNPGWLSKIQISGKRNQTYRTLLRPIYPTCQEQGISHLRHGTPPLRWMPTFMMPAILLTRPKPSPSLCHHILSGGPLWFFMCLEACMWDNKFVDREAKGATNRGLFETQQQRWKRGRGRKWRCDWIWCENLPDWTLKNIYMSEGLLQNLNSERKFGKKNFMHSITTMDIIQNMSS